MFDTDAGDIVWSDMTVSSSVGAGVSESYSAQINGNQILTVYAQADGVGGIQQQRAIITGALCVDDSTAVCNTAGRTAGYIYAHGTAITGMDIAENYPTTTPLS
jgi:hypothetical protein